jgi:hypothetical protein
MMNANVYAVYGHVKTKPIVHVDLESSPQMHTDGQRITLR